MNQKIRFLKNLSTGLVVIAMVFAFLIAGIRIFGVQVYGVLTGSMEPAYPTGSLIYVKQVDAKDLRVNDVITFSISPGVIATHRIVEIVPDEQYPTIMRYRTKGDANKDVDASLVSANNIIGKAIFAVPKLGHLANYIQQPPGIYVAILVCGLMIAFVFYTDSLDNKQKQAEGQHWQSDEKKNFDLVALINKASMKLLKRPLIEQKPGEALIRGYTPAQPQQMRYPTYQQPVQYTQQMYYPQQYQQPMQYPQGYQQQMQQPQQGQQMYATQQPYYPQQGQAYQQMLPQQFQPQSAYPQQYYTQQRYEQPPYQQPQQNMQAPYPMQQNSAGQHQRSRRTERMQ